MHLEFSEVVFVVNFGLNFSVAGGYREMRHGFVTDARFQIVEVTVMTGVQAGNVCVGIELRQQVRVNAQAQSRKRRAVFFRAALVIKFVVAVFCLTFYGAFPQQARQAVTPREAAVFVRLYRIGDIKLNVVQRVFRLDISLIPLAAESQRIADAVISVSRAVNVNVIDRQSFVTPN